MTQLLARIDTSTSPEASVLLLASLARAKLLYGDVEGTRKDMGKALSILDTDLAGTSVEPAVNAAYYSIAADYYKVHFFLSLSSPPPRLRLLSEWLGG